MTERHFSRFLRSKWTANPCLPFNLEITLRRRRFSDEALLKQLRITRSAGVPLVGDLTILRVRLVRENEQARYFESASSLLTSNGQLAVLLVGLDDLS